MLDTIDFVSSHINFHQILEIVQFGDLFDLIVFDEDLFQLFELLFAELFNICQTTLINLNLLEFSEFWESTKIFQICIGI